MFHNALLDMPGWCRGLQMLARRRSPSGAPGALNCGFLGHAALCSLVARGGRAAGAARPGARRGAAGTAPAVGRARASVALPCAAVLAPFAAFQAFGYLQLCAAPGAESHAREHFRPQNGTCAAAMPDMARRLDPRPAWCRARLPYLYGHVQSAYWGVGFLRSYRWSQARRSLCAPAACVLPGVDSDVRPCACMHAPATDPPCAAMRAGCAVAHFQAFLLFRPGVN